MYGDNMHTHIVAIIPARGGSKGIPDKNIREFAGRPLIAHTIASAKESERITRIIVSTDSEKIAGIAKEYGAEVPFLRPPELAQDKSPVADAVLHILSELKQRELYEPDCIVLLQPTSPLRNSGDIDGVINLLEKSGADSVVTVTETEPLVYTRSPEGELRLISDESFLSSTNRQELNRTYKLDGSMVYAVTARSFRETQSFLGGKLFGYVIPRWRAVDLDEPQDFLVGELVYKNAHAIKQALDGFK